MKSHELNLLTISDMKDPDLVLVTDSQDVEAVKQYLKLPKEDLDDYDGFFVKVGQGEYTKCYGFSGSVPWLWKTITDLSDNLV